MESVMTKLKIHLTLTLSLFLLFGCAHLNGGVANKAFTKDLAVEATTVLTQYYQLKNVEKFMTLVSPKYQGEDGQGGYGKFETELTEFLTNTKSVVLEVSVGKVVEGENRVVVETEWKRTFVGADGKGKTLSGNTKLVFIRYDGNTLKLFSVLGDTIFLGASAR
jgi:hypothetical protein